MRCPYLLSNRTLSNAIILFLLFGTSILLGYAITAQLDRQKALLNDAATYWQIAEQISSFGILLPFTERGWFVDIGYPIFLSLILQISDGSYRAGQMANVLMVSICGLLVYIMIRKIVVQISGEFCDAWHNSALAGSFCLSPCFLTFSGKLYSEILAAFFLCLMMIGIIYLWDQQRLIWPVRLVNASVFIIGTVGFLLTKSAFFPLVFAYFALFLLFHKRFLLLALAISFLVVFPYQISAQSGGRGQHNFAVQVGKLEIGWTYQEILIGSVFSFSNTLGGMVFPSYSRQYEQNPTPTPVTNDPNNPWLGTGYERNPYMKAHELRKGGFTYIEGVRKISSDPLRYAIIVICTLPAMMAPEGLYPVVSDALPFGLRVISWLVLKIFLSFAIWFGTVSFVISNRNNSLVITLAAPLVLFILVYGNFNLEQRWLFPLLPLLWTLSISQLLLVTGRCRAFSRPNSIMAS